jgi:AcrR family transcriptional regulator
VRKAGANRDITWLSIRKAAVELLYQRGFEGMKLRELSSAAGLQAGSLYNYFSSKEELLFRLVNETMDELITELASAIAEDNDPVEQLKRVIRVLVVRHSERRKEVYIGHLEMRGMPEERLRDYIQRRDRVERFLQEIISAGRKAGKFHAPDEKIACMAIFTMLTGIADWYRPNGRLSVKQLTAAYTATILKVLEPSAAGAAPKKHAARKVAAAAA